MLLGRNCHIPCTGWIHVTGSAREASATAELAFLAKRKSLPTLMVSTVPLCADRGRNLGPSEHVSLPTLCQSGKKDLLKPHAMTGNELFCSREFRCLCIATMLSCYMTPCQPLTARTDDLYPFVYYLNFYTPCGTYLLRVNKLVSNQIKLTIL